ncbi:MAG: hypothetical protein H6679_04140 [Epsilonproteobacteria bacterium]|nr:hypothetical protein [Campylobacterota bacterium]
MNKKQTLLLCSLLLGLSQQAWCSEAADALKAARKAAEKGAAAMGQRPPSQYTKTPADAKEHEEKKQQRAAQRKEAEEKKRDGAMEIAQALKEEKFGTGQQPLRPLPMPPSQKTEPIEKEPPVQMRAPEEVARLQQNRLKASILSQPVKEVPLTKEEKKRLKKLEKKAAKNIEANLKTAEVKKDYDLPPDDDVPPPPYSLVDPAITKALDDNNSPNNRAITAAEIPGVLDVGAAKNIIKTANISEAEEDGTKKEIDAVAAGEKKGFKAATVRTFEKIGGSIPGSKGWSPKKKRTVGAMVMLGGLGLVAGGIGLAVWAAVESGSRNETEREMDMIKAEEGYTLETDAYQQMLQDDINRLSADGYTVSVTRDDAGNIVAYSATQEGFANITFEDNEYLRTMIENAMQEQKEAESEQEVVFR